jgi:cytoskeletal protein RodZ
MSILLAQELRQARQEAGLSLQEVAAGTHIKLRYLEALERGDLDALPSTAQARGFLRVYANFLNRDPQAFIRLMDETGDNGVEQAPFVPYQSDISEPAPEEIEAEQLRQEFSTRGALHMQEIGQQLKRHREILGLSLQDVERHTHLRLHYLKALEEGDIAALPSPVQGRGMLKNYADFLGLDPDSLLLTFADAIQAQHAARVPERTRPRPPEKQPRRLSQFRRIFTGDLFITLGIIGVLILFVIWGVFQIAAARASITPTPDPPSIADVLAPTSSPTQAITATSEPGEAGEGAVVVGVTPLVTASPTPEIHLPALDTTPGSLQLAISARQRAWMRVLVDGEVVFEGITVIGTVYPFTAAEQVEVLTGNGGGLIIYYNNQNLGPLGVFGEVVHRIYTAGGVLTPTATITPTPTQTPRFSPTPPATSMPGGLP